MNAVTKYSNRGLFGDIEEFLNLPLAQAWTPAVDIMDDKDHLTIKADLPGVKKEDIDVSVHEGVLTIRGEKKTENETHKKDAVCTERFYGSFERSILLPSSVDESKINASYKDGVLVLALSKREEVKPKKVMIE